MNIYIYKIDMPDCLTIRFSQPIFLKTKLQHTAKHCNTLQHTATHRTGLTDCLTKESRHSVFDPHLSFQSPTFVSLSALVTYEAPREMRITHRARITLVSYVTREVRIHLVCASLLVRQERCERDL